MFTSMVYNMTGNVDGSSEFILSDEVHNEIVAIIKSSKVPSRKYEQIILQRVKNVAPVTIRSIISLEFQRKMKKNHYRFVNSAVDLYKRYKEAVTNNADSGILLRISETIDFAPALLSRLILEQYFENDSSTPPATRASISKLMKDTTLIEDGKLAHEIYLAILYDDQYGPIADISKNSVGVEYEHKLKRKVIEKGLTYQDEEDLRSRGYDRTPDIKLDVPIAVNGFVVNWIESKANFGDRISHEEYIKDQYASYWNRFGTGLVIYWMGYVNSIATSVEKRFIVRHEFPEEITFMDPLINTNVPKHLVQQSVSNIMEKG